MVTVKIIVAFFLAVTGGLAFASKLLALGRTEPPANGARLARIHRFAGWGFGGALALNTLLGLILLDRAGDSLALRPVLHWHLALALDALFLLKIALAKRFRAYLRWVPGLGVALAVSAFILIIGSAGFALLTGTGSRSAAVSASAGLRVASDAPLRAADAENGREIFAGLCSGCHATTPGRDKAGPTLAGLFKADKLPASGRPATEEYVRLQLIKPIGSMPAFTTLTPSEWADLLAFLRTI